MKKELKQLLYFNAFKDVVEIFGETECGCNELDIEKIANFVASDTFFFKTFNLANEEDILNYVTNKILDGFPIWEFLKLTSWQKDMLVKSFKQECEDEYNPTWEISFDYTEDNFKLLEIINSILEYHNKELIDVLNTIKDKEGEYKNEE